VALRGVIAGGDAERAGSRLGHGALLGGGADAEAVIHALNLPNGPGSVTAAVTEVRGELK
jgi:hypothetical protein